MSDQSNDVITGMDMPGWIVGQKEAFEAALSGEPLEVSLGVLVRTAIQHLGHDARTAFYLADPRGMTLHHVVGMSASYAECVDGFKIGADSLACGLAVYNGKPVITPDVRAEPRWKPWLWLAEKYDFRACWSFPVQTSTGRVVGTFAIYLKEPREPQPGEQMLAAALQQASAIIIDRQEAAQDRDRARKEAETANAALREADRRKDEFLATLAHELRNPLAPLRNSLYILRAAGTGSGVAERAYDIIERQVNQLVRLVDDLLEVSRITSGKIELRKERVELAGIIRSAVEISKPHIEAAQQQLAISLPQDPVILDADPIRVTQILANILNNAAKYTKHGGQIWLAAFCDETTAAVSVRDNGVGIPADMLSKVFDLFTQVEHTYNRAQGGLGIGLTLARNLAAMHGGTLEAKSNGVNKGSEFIMRLPLAAGVHPAEPKETHSRLTAVASRRILVVDDNRDSADALGMLLELLGADVQTANNGAAALDALSKYRPDVVLLDIGMPGMDGYEIARRVRQTPEDRKIPLIAVSGRGQEKERRLGREAGFDHYLVKPVDLNALQALLDSDLQLDARNWDGTRTQTVPLSDKDPLA